MIKSHILWINAVLLAACLILSFSAALLYIAVPTKIEIPKPKERTTALPKSSFAASKQKLDAIGPPLINLPFSPMTLQLPDLRNYLVYYGHNDRPDVDPNKSLMHFSIVNSDQFAAVYPNQPLYLVYDKTNSSSKYLFSGDNRETSLWIKAIPEAKEALVTVAMKNEKGQVIRKPEVYANFRLTEKEYSRIGLRNWFIDSLRVDGTLLARQRARWFGSDLFIDRHGGDEYREYVGKQRVDFENQHGIYSVYIDEGDALAWKNGRWEKIILGEESRKYPLLVLKSVDDRLLKFELWDVDGRLKIVLNLIRSRDVSSNIDVEKMFKFVGARTRTQLMFEVKDKRVIISPHDWLVYIDGEWKKLTTPQEIDDYVNRKLIGPLFVIDGIERDDGRQILMGTVFNSSRSGQTAVEIPLQQGIVMDRATEESFLPDRFRGARERLIEPGADIPHTIAPGEGRPNLRDLSPEDRKRYLETLRRSQNR